MTEVEAPVDLPLSFSETLLLSKRDFAQFTASLENPPPATPEMRAAMREYQQLKAACPKANL